MSSRVVYLMRGLPACGKSYTAQKLAGEAGLVCETDGYFYSEVGDDPGHYDFSKSLLKDARCWNFERFAIAVDASVSPIVVDRGNGLNLETQRYAHYAIDRGYEVELKEPESEWWHEIRVLLKYKQVTRPILHAWADRLATMSNATHRVPASTIRGWMDKWQCDITIEDILKFDGQEPDKTDDAP